MNETQGAVAAVGRAWTLAWLAAAVLAGGCDLAPPIHLPQVEGVQRAVREPREERDRTYLRCSKEALREPGGDERELVACMEAAGFAFLPPSAQNRRDACVTALETPGVLPEAYCFAKRED